jgi:hypothetical protein
VDRGDQVVVHPFEKEVRIRMTKSKLTLPDKRATLSACSYATGARSYTVVYGRYIPKAWVSVARNGHCSALTRREEPGLRYCGSDDHENLGPGLW